MGSRKLDTDLGQHRDITRRDFIYGTSMVVGGALAAGCDSEAPPVPPEAYEFAVGEDWYGPGGVGDYQLSHGNTPDLLRAAHEIRDGRFAGGEIDATDTGEQYDMVIVGGGFAGLGAAHHFNRLYQGGTALVIDNHPMFGGEAKRNDFMIDDVMLSGPQGSNDFAVQPETGNDGDYFTALGMPRDFEFVEPQGDASGMRIPLDNYDYLHWHHDTYDVGHFFRGAANPWVKDVWGSGLGDAGWTAEVKQAFERLRDQVLEPPAGQELGPWLDSMTLKECYENVLGMPPAVTAYYDPIMASIIGLGCDGLSAHWGSYFSMPGFTRPADLQGPPLLSFPGGNAAIARHFVKKMIPPAIGGSSLEAILFAPVRLNQLDRSGNPVRIRLNSTVVRVEERGRGVRVTYTNGGETWQVNARTVVMASGGWVNRHVIRDLPQSYLEAYDAFMHSPVLVANVALTNWRFLQKLGISAAIWSGGEFGFTCNIRRPMVVPNFTQPLDPDQPIVLTFYAPVFRPGMPAKQQGIAGRAELLGTPFAEYERRIRAQMTELFAAGGFDAERDIAGIVLNRWGHAYVNPGPGFRFGVNGDTPPPDVIREPLGRIAIGHSELRGHQYWTGAAGEGRRAVQALADRYF